ncbi:MAG: T9SS type A sorting domain-containing protein, partial [Rhodothermales bacterium]|nr:T9SS type A sorting domain-containing protein [Rhodothermales bacterium]
YLLIAGTHAFVSDQVGAGIEQPLVVQPAYPNPTPGRFTVDYALKNPGAVEITVVDILGREIVRRDLGRRDRGLHQASLDLDANGHAVASGIYFVIVRGDGAAARSQKIVVVR